ncbi:MAG: hypothetical protein KDB21_17110 [Acidimicrobiales bacterium]|nr:hypothetical protein [Acidimicrobiales bacterium]
MGRRRLSTIIVASVMSLIGLPLVTLPAGAQAELPAGAQEATPTQEAPALDMIEAEGWSVVDGDLALPEGLRQIQEAHRAEQAALLGDAAFVPEALLGAGFSVIDGYAGNRGAYTIRLQQSDGVENLRSGLTLAASRLHGHTNGYFEVAGGLTAQTEPASGEILVVVSATSPCTGNWVGCAGPRTAERDPITNQWYLVSGMVWIHPVVLGYSEANRQHVLEHELGHALGLLHYETTFEGRYQIMHPYRYDSATFDSGDVNGLHYLHPTAPSNDPFSSSKAVASGGSVEVLATFGSTHEGSEPAHAGVANGGSVWYSWTAPSTGMAEVNTYGSSYDTVLGVYTGSQVGSLSQVGSNDEADAVLGGFSRLVFPVVQGQTYRVAVDGHDGGAGVAKTAIVAPISGGYTPMNPRRIIDTRNGIGYTGGKIGPDRILTVQIGGNVGIPTNARAAVLNVTVTEPVANGYLTVYPCDSPVLGASSLNYSAGETIPNLVVTRTSVNNNGQVCIYSKSDTHVVVDINGYYTETSGYDYQPLQPARILDTRNGAGAGRTTPLNAGETWMLKVGGTGGAPSNAAAAVMNVTATQPTGSGYVTLWPCDQPRPTAANLNFTAGQTFPNLVMADLDNTGTVCIYAHTQVHLIIDLNGYFAGTGTQLSPLTPARVLDTRNGVGAGRTTPLASGETLVLDVWGNGGVPDGADAAVLNLAVTQPQGSGFVTLWPCDQPRPTAANLNFTAGETIANLAVTDLDAQGQVCIYTLTATHVVLDVSGYTS